jgi:hypothetical protein
MQKPKWYLTASLCLNVVLACGLLAAWRRAAKKDISLTEPFEVTATTNGYVVAYQKGRLFWTVDHGMLSMNIGPDQSATFNFDSTNGQVRNIVLEIKPTDGSSPYWISDFNGDGIPDQRRFERSNEKQAFYRGEFRSLFATNGAQCVMDGGKMIEVKFDGRSWEPNKAQR